MKRKLIWQGNNSATLTLPINWVREKELESGDEIEVVPSGEHLIIGSKKNNYKRTINIELKEKHNSVVKKLLALLYRSGYDEISIVFPNSSIEDHVQQMVWKQMVGFEIVKIKENHLLIKDIADLDPESFSILFKKSFLLLLNFAKETIYHIKNKDQKALERLIAQDEEINKITNLCLRLLNKKMNDKKKIGIFYYMLSSMEKLSDCFRDLAVTCLKEKKSVMSPDAMQVFENITGKMQQIYFLYYRFDLDKTLLLNDELRSLYDRSGKDFTNNSFYHYLHSIIQKMEALTGGAIALNIEGEEFVRKEDWIS